MGDPWDLEVSSGSETRVSYSTLCKVSKIEAHKSKPSSDENLSPYPGVKQTYSLKIYGNAVICPP